MSSRDVDREQLRIRDFTEQQCPRFRARIKIVFDAFRVNLYSAYYVTVLHVLCWNWQLGVYEQPVIIVLYLKALLSLV